MVIKSGRQITGIATSCRITAQLIEEIKALVQPGATGKQIDNFAYDYICKHKGKPAFLGVPGNSGAPPFPASLCWSINEQIVHGIPDDRPVQPGDLIKIDTGVIYQGYYSDCAITIALPPVTPVVENLMAGTQKALSAGIAAMKVGNHLSDISAAIGSTLLNHKLKIIKELTGHGVGLSLHESPTIVNFGVPGQGPKLKNGIVFALEPMASLGSSDIILGSNRWAYLTADGSVAAHFEHTIAIWHDQTWVLTDGNADFNPEIFSD